jgi:hypothetical protein
VDCDVLAQVNESDALPESVDRIEKTFGGGGATSTVLVVNHRSTGTSPDRGGTK